MKHKHLTGYIEKAADGAEYDGTFILSTDSPDRDGDVIDQAGWSLDNFVKNPIALWQHDHRNPVGRWENIRVETNRLVADLKLGSTKMAQMTKQLIQDGILRAVSVGFRPLDYEPLEDDAPAKGWLIKAAELLEASLVSVPANQEALQISKSLGLSDDERSVIFEGAEPQETDKSVTPPPKEGAPLSKSARTFNRPLKPKKESKMNLSERIQEAQEALTDLRADLKTAIEQYAEDATQENQELVNEYTKNVKAAETHLHTLTEAEAQLKDELSAATPAPAPKKAFSKPKAPALITSTKNYEEGEIFFKQAAVTALAAVQRTSVNEVLRDRYRNDKGLEAVMAKADSTIGTTTGTNWAAPLLEESVEGFLDLFTNNSVYGALRARGTALNFAGKGSIKIPSRGSTKKPSGAFVAEGAPIPVKEAYFTSQTMTPDKMGVIVPFAEELVTATNNQIETIIRDAVVQDTAESLDAILLDDTAASTTRPAGLKNGVSLTNSAGATAANVATDVKTLMANFVSTDSPKDVVFIMNGARVLGLRTIATTTGERAFPEINSGNLMGIPVVESGNCTAAEVYSVNCSAFYTAYDAPRFSMSNTAVIHMEDTTPLEIVSGVPTTADPVRSLFQTDSMAIRMILPVTWKMVRASMVDGIDVVAW